MRVVIADDEEDIIESTQALLELDGHEVHGVNDALEIARTVEAVTPEVLLQDVHMPGLDLGKLLASIRGNEKSRGVTIILFTAAPEIGGHEDFVHADGLLRKPFDADELHRALRLVRSDEGRERKPLS